MLGWRRAVVAVETRFTVVDGVFWRVFIGRKGVFGAVRARLVVLHDLGHTSGVETLLLCRFPSYLGPWRWGCNHLGFRRPKLVFSCLRLRAARWLPKSGHQFLAFNRSSRFLQKMEVEALHEHPL